ncbi:MAG TPA: ABC transporter ATP-binding protein, partial [Candidatus Limnocylindrales bacterium]|nr:ABC transporter ATP-binding protein [Candidatus Limnocylindrales bacterium]
MRAQAATVAPPAPIEDDVPAALLSVRDLRITFGSGKRTVHAVNGVSYDVAAGETIGIVGESGCGKSVSALAVMRLLPKPAARLGADTRILFEGRELTELPESAMRQLRGEELAMIFQDPMTSLNPSLTIGRQVTEVLEAHRGVRGEAAKERAAELLETVGIPHARKRLGDYPHQFSGGMRQRVMIAMALALEPKLLIADEPTTALDVTVQASVLDLLDDLRQQHDMSMIIITHDMGVVAEAADDIVVMYAGQIVEHATTLDLFDRPEHPYTEALLGALPQIGDENVRTGRLTAIP